MLTQATELRLRLAGRPELVERGAAVRSTDCAASLSWSSGLVTDWGVQSRLVHYIARQTRSQLSIVLSGRGYVTTEHGNVTLGEGDVVELDQNLHDAEGYAMDGARWSEVLVVEWDHASRFGDAHRGPPRLGRIARCDVEGLRELTARVTTTPAETWLDELAARLRALGLRTPTRWVAPPPPPPAIGELYRALGAAKQLIDAHVSITDVAEKLGLSERHVRRGLDVLAKRFGMTIDGWRTFVSDQRMHRAQIFLSVPGMALRDVARVSGFRSQIALTHAIANRAGTTPARLARELRERWA